MPTITLIGSAFVLFGMILIAFTPTEKIINVISAPSWGTGVVIMSADGTTAASAAVPFAEDGKVIAWDDKRKLYRWVPAPADPDDGKR